MKKAVTCPRCGETITLYRNPVPAVDIIIRVGAGIVLIKRKNPPHGWALPGGFIDYGESAESAAIREAREETSLDIRRLKLFGVYSDPSRDPRHHTLAVVFTAVGEGTLKAADDADLIGVFQRRTLPEPMAFDHAQILDEFFREMERLQAALDW